ncbi:SCF ubiquitin ligase complex subunit [Emydomyces testavorans]|uniref:SCF ubiquitin ligase complex subunit n=1 Tax=Emydomyces testavorans TaxID=2070801 RepID=A0AAF0IG45_9EURO|nr:SCF ubiquitin ligase complex subunit [Emydomyces testavorans]
MFRSRGHFRHSAGTASESSSSTSPERVADDDTDFFMQVNDSQSSVGVGNLRDLQVDTRQSVALPPISRLPSELLIAIFAKLSSPTDMLNCMRVCQRWATNCVAILWHRPSCNTWENLEKVAGAISNPNSYFPYYEFVKRLNLATLSTMVNDGTIISFAQCKRIERLTLTNCSTLTDTGVSDLVDGNSHLQALDMSELKSLTDHTIFIVARNCLRLQGLNITSCVKVTDDALVTLAESCRQLKRLKLNGVVQVTDRSIQAFVDNCPSMLEIDLQGCRLITNSVVTTLLSTLRYLRELRLAHCDITDQAFLHLPERITFDSLRILDLTACENVRDDAVEKIISSTPRLRNLVLSKCRFITDRAVQAICKLGRNIHYVHLGHCSNITDSAVTQLVKSCNRIRYIDLACCNRLTDASVQQLATLPKLRRIGLVKCQAITDRSILALAKPRIPQHPLGIHQLLNHCPRLTHLSLTGVHAFLREELTAFCREAPPEFTPQQREVFCVFSGGGVSRLRDFLNQAAMAYHRDFEEGTMFDDADEIDEDEGQVTGLMNATGLNDDDDETPEGTTAPIQG